MTPGITGFVAGTTRAVAEMEKHRYEYPVDDYHLLRGIIFGVLAVARENLGAPAAVEMADEVAADMFDVVRKNSNLPVPSPLEPFIE